MFKTRDFELKQNHTFFFDNNIWMLLFCPVGYHDKQAQDRASKFLDRLISFNREAIAISNLILSEFSNASLRLDFDFWKKETGNYTANFKKDYFQTQRSKEIRRLIEDTIRTKLLKIATLKTPDSFHCIDLESILDLYKNLDYNDAYIYKICIDRSFILFTNDSDFDNLQKIQIIKP